MIIVEIIFLLMLLELGLVEKPKQTYN